VNPITIWLEHANPRARYAAKQLFEGMLGWPVRWAEDSEDLRPAEGPCLAYAQAAPDGAFHMMPCGWLSKLDREPIEPETLDLADAKALFPIQGGQLPFDPLAAAFYLLARYEEWVGLPADAHGRPATAAMHAARHGYLQLPVVDEWALLVARKWRALDSRVPIPERRYSQMVTVDLDNGFKYLGREAWRSAAGLVRDALRARWHEAKERLMVLAGREPDPFMLDEEVLACFSYSAQRSIAFVLAAARGPLDHAVPVSDKRYAEYLRGLSQRMELGLHPSYGSSETAGLMQAEHDALVDAVCLPVASSRQHFLRTRLPSTFREAIALGMREEHSMGCHDQIGFRAGTCTPYEWYDLDREEATRLIIHPFAVMDNTLRMKLALAPEDAVARVMPMIAATRKVDGRFTGLWHESFLASSGEALAWRKAILRIVQLAAP
jgi:hypothetical protein